MRIAKTDDFQDEVAVWLRDVYGEILGIVNPATARYGDVEDAFRGHTPAGQRTRMVTLFIGLCDYAGLVPDDSNLRGSIRSQKREAGAGAKKRLRSRSKPGDTGRRAPERSQVEKPKADEPERMSKGDMMDVLSRQRTVLHPFIQGLVDALPPVGTAWPSDTREKWLNAARATFDLMYELPSEDSEEAMS